MDLINKINEILPKMKLQMNAKQLYSLHDMYMTIAQYDPENTGFIPKMKFVNFLSLLGIFLKTQELTELHLYLETDKNNGYVQLEKFVSLFRMDPPEKLIKNVTEIFKQISLGLNTIHIDRLKESIQMNNHHLVKILKKDKELTRSYLDRCIDFILGTKPEMDLNEFKELHYNMLWVLPDTEVSFWVEHIPELWGVTLN